MSYVITEPCAGVKDGSCVDVCPVACIHTTPEAPQFYIDPDVCIDCEQCVLVCPVDAIFLDSDVPAKWMDYLEINAAFFRENKAADSIRGEEAEAIVQALQAYAAQHGLSIATAVLNRSGETARLSAMPGAAADALGEAERKAYTALAYRVWTNQVRPGAKPPGLAGAPVDEARMLLRAGGVPLVRDGVMIGAAGIAGTDDQAAILCCQVATEVLRSAVH